MDLSLSQKSNLPENFKDQIRLDLLDLFKQKRDKYRTEIRNCRLSSELNMKRFKYSDNFIGAPLPFSGISQENRCVFYEEVCFLIKSHANKSNIIGLIESLNKLKKLISEDFEDSFKFIKKIGVLDEIIHFFDENYDEFMDVQLQSLWNFSNIISFDVDDNFIVGFLKSNASIINNLMRFIKSNNDLLLQNTLWTLGNIAGKSNDLRFQLFDHDIIEKILDIFEEKERGVKTLIEALWLISNLCIGNPYPSYSEVKKLLPLLQKCLIISEPLVLEYAMWTFSYLSDGNNQQIKDVLALGITAKIINLMTHKKKEIKLPSVRTVCNLLTSDDSDTEIMIENGLFDHFILLLDDENKLVRKEISWGISNILACNEEIIEKICSHKLIDKIFNHCFYDEYLIREELIMGLASAVTKASKNEMMMFVEKEILTLLLQMLEFPDSKLIVHILKGLEALLDFLREYSVNCLENKMLRDKLEELQYHPDQGVLERTQTIIDKFFVTD